jgi:hypothetical protein
LRWRRHLDGDCGGGGTAAGRAFRRSNVPAAIIIIIIIIIKEEEEEEDEEEEDLGPGCSCFLENGAGARLIRASVPIKSIRNK